MAGTGNNNYYFYSCRFEGAGSLAILAADNTDARDVILLRSGNNLTAMDIITMIMMHAVIDI